MKMNIRSLVHDLGGQAEIHRRLVTAGYAISLGAIEKWCSRGSIPSHWLARLQKLATEAGQTLNLANYVDQEKQA
jgi:hypothetical protein